MKRFSVPGLLLLLALLSTSVEASTLFGRVIEVNDGDVITVFNLNRPVRIRLLAVDAPEAKQEFGDVAKKHLSELVYDKSVLVEYWGIAADGSLVGRVMLNNTDVGAQMIRDGAAWFDACSQDRLSAADQEMYRESQRAARNERRGLWQAENPIAPWEYVRAIALRRNPAASLNAIMPAASPAPNRPTPELTNLTLLAKRMGHPSGPTDADVAWAASSARKNWEPFRPPGENFSALMPDDGQTKKISVPFGGGGEVIDVNVRAARDGWAIYALMWISGPSFGESDRLAIDSTVQGFMKGFGEGYQGRNTNAFVCDLQDGRRFVAGGYSATDFDLSTCTLPTKVRAYTRVIGGERQMYIGAVFYIEEDPNVSRFIKSFTVGTAISKPKRSTAKLSH